MLESSRRLLPLHTGVSSVCENAECRITDDISSPLSWPSHTRIIYHIITDDDLSSQDLTLLQTVNMETVVKIDRYT